MEAFCHLTVVDELGYVTGQSSVSPHHPWTISSLFGAFSTQFPLERTQSCYFVPLTWGEQGWNDKQILSQFSKRELGHTCAQQRGEPQASVHPLFTQIWAQTMKVIQDLSASYYLLMHAPVNNLISTLLTFLGSCITPTSLCDIFLLCAHTVGQLSLTLPFWFATTYNNCFGGFRNKN